jgi:probable phosphoglycerate mutase
MQGGPDRIVIVRHAESLRNAVRRGRFFKDEEEKAKVGALANHDIPITARGEAQAAATGLALRKKFGVPDAVYHSGYRRTIQTTEGLLAAYPDRERGAIPVHEHIFLRERDSGYTYDMTEEEAERSFPFLTRHWGTFGQFFAMPIGGESLARAAERVYHLLREIRESHDGGTVMLVTHGGIVLALRYWLEGLALADLGDKFVSARNCGVTVYERRDDGRYALAEYDTVLYAQDQP